MHLEISDDGSPISPNYIDSELYEGPKPYYPLISDSREIQIGRYEGTCRYGAGESSCIVNVTYINAPYIHILIESVHNKEEIAMDDNDVALEINCSVLSERQISTVSEGYIENIVWQLLHDVDIVGDEKTEISEMLVHLINFPYFQSTDYVPILHNRQGFALYTLSFSLDNFDIRVSSIIETGNQHVLLNSYGGHQLTHVAMIRKIDFGVFSILDAKSIIELFELMMSIIAGKRIVGLLPVGFDRNGEAVWKNIPAPTMISEVFDNWSFFNTYTDYLQMQVVEVALRLEQIKNDNKIRDLRSIVDWYLEAQSATSAEVRLVTSIICLEKMSVFASVQKSRSQNTNKVKNLLHTCNISTKLTQPIAATQTKSNNGKLLVNPKTYDDLIEIAYSIRSDLVHPVKEYDFTQDTINYVSWELLQIINLALLCSIGYEGDYRARNSHKYFVKPVPVPWNFDDNSES